MGKDYPHNPSEITKAILSTKLKSTRNYVLTLNQAREHCHIEFDLVVVSQF